MWYILINYLWKFSISNFFSWLAENIIFISSYNILNFRRPFMFCILSLVDKFHLMHKHKKKKKKDLSHYDANALLCFSLEKLSFRLCFNLALSFWSLKCFLRIHYICCKFVMHALCLLSEGEVEDIFVCFLRSTRFVHHILQWFHDLAIIGRKTKSSIYIILEFK